MSQRLYHWLVLAACSALIAAAFFLDVDKLGVYLFGIKWPMHCFLYHTFGVKCALCGMSRSLVSIGHGSWQAGFEYHHLGPALFVYAIIQIPYRLWKIVTFPKKTTLTTRAISILSIVLLAAIFFNWFYYLVQRLL